MSKSSRRVVFWTTLTAAGLGVTLAAGTSAGQRVLGSWQDAVATWGSLGTLASGTAGGLAAVRRAGQAVRSALSRVSSLVEGRGD